jgi:hypothetical protein
MKKILLTMVALMTITVAMAQNNKGNQPPKQMTAEEMTTQMSSKLGLSEAQALKVKALNKEYSSVFQGPGKGGKCPPKGNCSTSKKPSCGNGERPQMTDAQKTQMKQNMAKRQEYETKLKSILTESQYKTYQNMQPQRGGKGCKGGKDKSCKNKGE